MNSLLKEPAPVRPSPETESLFRRLKRLLKKQEAEPAFLWNDPALAKAPDLRLFSAFEAEIAACPDCAAGPDRYACELETEDNCRLPLCERHSCRHLSLSHPHSELYQEQRLRYVQSLIAAGWVSKAETPECLLTAQGVFPRIMHNNWFAFCATYMTGAYAPLAYPLILTWKSVEVNADTAASDANVQALQDMFDEFNYRWNTVHQGGTASENYTSCLATALDPEFRLLPQDNSEPPAAQDTPYGCQINATAAPGKIAKSQRSFFSSKVGGSLHPEPSYWPEIKIDRNFSLRCHSVDTGKDGSGSGCIKLSAAYRLMKRGAARYFIHRGLLMLYFVHFAADHSGKGQYIVLPDDEFPTTDPDGNPLPPDTNLVIDADNFNDRVRWQQCTITAFFPIYPTPFQEVPHFMLEPVHMMENLCKLVDGSRLAANARRVAFELARDLPWQIAQGDHMPKFNSFFATDPWHYERSERAEQKLAELFQENPAATAIQAAHGSPWCSPQVMGQLTKTWDVWQGEQLRKKPLPTAPISGHRLWAFFPYYAGVPEPEPGSCGLVFNRDNPNQPVGLTGNRRDFRKKSKNALDGFDFDDSVYIVLLDCGYNQYRLYVMREPMSPEGGIMPLISDQDARRLLNNGVYAYRQTGDQDWPDLYASIDGELIRQPVVVSDPAPDLELWSNREEDFITQVTWMTRFRRFYGGVVNSLYALYFSGLFKPPQDFGMLSDALDDALGGNRNPDSRQQYYMARILAEIQAGHPVEQCMYSRIESKVKALHEEREAALPPAERFGPLQPQTFCPPHHDLLRETTREAIATLREASQTMRMLANGPLPELLREHPEATVQHAAQAYAARNELWRDYAQQCRELKEDKSLSPDQKDEARKELEQQVKAGIDQALNEAYDQWRQTEAYQEGRVVDGDLFGCYVQLVLTKDRRWSPPKVRPGAAKDPAAAAAVATPAAARAISPPETRDADRAFPREEREAYYGRKGSVATALLEVKNGREFAPGQIAWVDVNDRKNPKLIAEDGKLLVVLPPYSCAAYIGCQVEIHGYMPVYDQENVWQRPNILVAQVLTAWDGTPFPREQAML